MVVFFQELPYNEKSKNSLRDAEKWKRGRLNAIQETGLYGMTFTAS